MFFHKFNSNLNLTLNESLLEGIPTMLHTYNTEQPWSKDPFWMEFSKPINKIGRAHV